MKNQFTKRNKKIIIKRIRTKLKKITYPKLRLKDEIENKLNFYNRIKNKNQRAKEKGPK